MVRESSYSFNPVRVPVCATRNHADSSVSFASSKCKARFRLIFALEGTALPLPRKLRKTERAKNDKTDTADKSVFATATGGILSRSRAFKSVLHDDKRRVSRVRAPTSKAKDLRARTSN